MPAITQASLTSTQSRFDDCFNTRRDWDAILQRQWPTELPPELAVLQEGIDYQTPDLEKALNDHVDVLKMNPTVYDVVPLSQTPTARKQARDILLWTARGWEYENEGRWWDRAVAEGQVRHGYKVMRLMHRPQKPADVAASTAEEILEETDKAARKQRHPFFWQDVDTYSVTWMGDESSEYGADVAFMEYELPYLDAQAELSRDKELLTLTDVGKVAWVGEGESCDDSTWHDKTVKVVVVDCRDPKNRRCQLDGCSHYQRVIQVYVMHDGGEIGEKNLVSETDSPYPGCSFMVIPGRQTSKRDPNLRFRPLMHGLYVESEITNRITTTLLVMMRGDYSDADLYVDVSQVQDPSLLPEDREQHYVDFQMGAKQEGKLQYVAGEIKKLPKSISPHMPTLRAEHIQKMGEYMPNRFQMGQAYTEASNATSTAFTLQMQQAQLPYNTCLSNSDAVQKKAWGYKYHAIKWWAMSDPEPTKFYAVTSGQSHIVDMNGSTPKAGQVIWVDANKLSLDFDLILRTKAETLAEEGVRWNVAKDQYDNGALAPDQLVRSAGIDDVEGQFEKLEEAWQQQIMEQDIQALIRQVNLRGFYGKTGLDVSQLVAMPVGGPQGQPPPQQMGSPPRQRQQGPPQGTTVAPNQPVTAGAPAPAMGQGSSPTGMSR